LKLIIGINNSKQQQGLTTNKKAPLHAKHVAGLFCVVVSGFFGAGNI
jgi:hypothetical protein